MMALDKADLVLIKLAEALAFPLFAVEVVAMMSSIANRNCDRLSADHLFALK